MTDTYIFGTKDDADVHADFNSSDSISVFIDIPDFDSEGINPYSWWRELFGAVESGNGRFNTLFGGSSPIITVMRATTYQGQPINAVSSSEFENNYDFIRDIQKSAANEYYNYISSIESAEGTNTHYGQYAQYLIPTEVKGGDENYLTDLKLDGNIFRNYLAHEYTTQTGGTLTSEIYDSLVIDLAQRDADLRAGSAVMPTANAIARTYYAALDAINLSPEAWFGTFFEEFVGSGSWAPGAFPNAFTSLDYNTSTLTDYFERITDYVRDAVVGVNNTGPQTKTITVNNTDYDLSARDMFLDFIGRHFNDSDSVLTTANIIGDTAYALIGFSGSVPSAILSKSLTDIAETFAEQIVTHIGNATFSADDILSDFIGDWLTGASRNADFINYFTAGILKNISDKFSANQATESDFKLLQDLMVSRFVDDFIDALSGDGEVTDGSFYQKYITAEISELQTVNYAVAQIANSINTAFGYGFEELKEIIDYEWARQGKIQDQDYTRFVESVEETASIQNLANQVFATIFSNPDAAIGQIKDGTLSLQTVDFSQGLSAELLNNIRLQFGEITDALLNNLGNFAYNFSTLIESVNADYSSQVSSVDTISGSYSGIVNATDYIESGATQHGIYTKYIFDHTNTNGANEDALIWFGSDANDEIVYLATGAKDKLFLGNGNNKVIGNFNNDGLYVITGSGNDDLTGGSGNDQIFGGAGNDIITGRNGADYLDGGTNSASSFEKDIADYAAQGSTITVLAHDTKENTFLVTDENGVTDEITNFELIKAGNGNDILDLRNTSINAFDIQNTGTIHTIPFDWGNGSKAFEFEGFDRIQLNNLGNEIKVNGIGNVNIIGGGGIDTALVKGVYKYSGLVADSSGIHSKYDGTTFDNIEIFYSPYVQSTALGYTYMNGGVFDYSGYASDGLYFSEGPDGVIIVTDKSGTNQSFDKIDKYFSTVFGTNNDDTVNIDFGGTFFSGLGDDQVSGVLNNYYYSGGNDVLKDTAKSIYLPTGANINDVSISWFGSSPPEAIISVAGYGQIHWQTAFSYFLYVYGYDENGQLVERKYFNEYYDFVTDEPYTQKIVNGGTGYGTQFVDEFTVFDSASSPKVISTYSGNDIITVEASSVRSHTIYGDDGDDTLTGAAGDDKLHGGSGNDILSGGSGNDTLYAGEGTDLLNGGSGVDHASYAYNNGAIYLDLSQSGQNVDKNYDGTTTQYSDTLTAIENATGTVYSDIFIGDGNDNEFHGLEGDDQYTGGLGADTFYIGSGLDEITDFDGSVDKISIEHLEASDTSEIEIIYTNSGSETIAAIYIAATGEQIANVHLPLGEQIPQAAFEFNSYSEPVFNPEPGDNTSNIDNGELILSDNVNYHHSQHIVIRNPGSATGGITGWGDNPYQTDIPESFWNQIVTAWSFGETDKFLYGGALDSFGIYAYVGSSYTTISIQGDDPYVGALFGTVTHSGSDEGSSITLPVPSSRGNGNDDTFVFYANNKYATYSVSDIVYEDVNAGFDTVVIEGATSEDIYISWTDTHGPLVVNFVGFPNYKIYIQGERHGEYGSDVTERIEQIILKSASGTEIIDIADGLELHGISGISDITNKGTIENDVMYGTDANDDIRGDGGDDTLFGQDGVDTIYAGLGDDTLSGGLGDDTLKGESGDDTYIWAVGDGNDLLWENGGTDQLILHNVLWQDIRFEREASTSNLLIHIGNETIEVLGHFSADTNNNSYYEYTQIESLLLDDGTVKDLTTNFTFTGTDEGEGIVGLREQACTLVGLAGDDNLQIHSIDKDDILIGGLGDDTLKGESGDDTYIWSVGDGNDQITDSSGNDTLVLQGVLATNITYAQSGNNLQIQIGSETITNTGFFQSGGAYRIEFISLDDGSTINLDEMFNVAPDAKDDLISVEMDDAVSGNVLSNNGNGADTDPEGQALTIIAGTYATAHGSITLLANGDFTYTPDTGYSGFDNYTYTLQDIYGVTDTASINITVLAPNAVNAINGTAGNDTLNGDPNGISDDTIIGYAGNDTLNGKLGNDTYEWSVGDGNDTIYETGGVDQLVLHGVTEADIRFEKYGNYHLRVHIGNEYIHLNNQLYSDYNNNTAYEYYMVESLLLDNGTTIDLTGSLTFTGTSSGDTIYALKQSDSVLYGLEGNDSLYGYDSNDTLIGGVGNDTLSAGLGNDIYEWAVGDGNDTITETGGVDQLVLHGVTEADIRFEKYGNYHLRVHVGDEYIHLNNQLHSDYNNNSAYDFRMVESLLLDNGTTIDLTGSLTFTGTSSGDTIYGLKQSDSVIYGLEGNDSLYTYAGNDTLIGGVGNDTLNAGLGNDIYEWSVGDGDDKITETGGIDQLVLHGVVASDITFSRGGSYNRDLKINIGSETITLDRQFYSDDLNNSNYDIYHIESLLLDDGTTIDLTGAIALTGTAANDTIYGLEQQDNYILGLGGNDTLNGYGFDDTLIGGVGNDTLNAGLGNDIYEWSVGDGDDKITETGGLDQLVLHGVVESDIRFEKAGSYNRDLRIHIDDETITLDRQLYSDDLNNSNYDTYHVESLLLDDGTVIDLTGSLTFTGTDANETVYGLEQIGSTLYGLAGNDTLNAFNANDVLYGGDGSDYLYGGTGDDILYGGSGVDMLYGQGGADTFVFEADSAFLNSDNIQDFDLASGDKLDISDLLIGYDPLNDAITDFVQITESGSNSYLSVDADGGADNFVQIAYIYNETGLTDEAALEASGNLIAA